ncbi:stimulated by retinoic acid 6 protein-like isoform X1, partial [Clarias magur]
SVQKSWFRKKVYEWDPYFKFPNRIIVTVVLSFLSLYMMMLLEQVLSSYYIDKLWDNISNYIYNSTLDLSKFIEHLDYAKYTWYMSSACAAFSSVIHISHVFVYY